MQPAKLYSTKKVTSAYVLKVMKVIISFCYDFENLIDIFFNHLDINVILLSSE